MSSRQPALGPFTYSGNLSTTPNTLFASSGLGGMQFSGTGVAASAAATLTPANYSYGSVQVGQKAATTFTLTNTGSIPFNIDSDTLTSTVFTIASTTCGARLPQGQQLRLHGHVRSYGCWIAERDLRRSR